MIRVPRAVATTTQWHKGHESMTKPSRSCLTSFKYKVSALGAMAGDWSFLSVRVLTLLLILLVSSRGSFGYWTTSSSPAQHSRQNKSMRENLPNFGEATTTLYRGGQPSKRGFRILAKMGVNIVVDLRGSRDSERKIVTHLGMQYVALPWQCSFPKDKTFAQFLTLLRKNRGKKIFVHCRLGDDRTAMMIASYRMAEEGWSAEKAEKEMEKFGFSFTHRRLICPGLSSYEEHFPQRFKTSPAFRDLH
jgi:tyrosine-protein phosphatase SIW14